MLKRIFKRNTHNQFFKVLAGFGRALNRLYENRNYDVHSNGEITVLKKLARFQPATIIDGGANVGNYANLISSTQMNCTVYSFEPVKETFEQLTRNLKGQLNVIPLNKGLFSENCQKSINIYSSDEHASIYKMDGHSSKPVKTVTIELVKGDDFLRENGISQVDLLKLDLEGAEYDALKGFENTLKEGRIKMVQFEYGNINISTKKLLIDYYNFFKPYGYRIGKIFPKNVEFRKYEVKYEDFLGPNFVAVKEDETELIKALEKK